MAYKDFTLEQVTTQFGLTQEFLPLFRGIKTFEPSPWLQETLSLSLRLALPSGNEKARSEFIIAPILLELERSYPNDIFIFSGKNLDVERNQGLVGECDFIISQGNIPLFMQLPILGIVEAKKDDINGGLGQCVAQMYGAQLFNKNHKSSLTIIYGCVTSGEIWQFLKLEENILTIDLDRYYINRVADIISCLRTVVEQAIFLKKE